MRVRHAGSLAAAGVWLAAFATFQCNAVLGIESAELDTSAATAGGGTGSGGSGQGGSTSGTGNTGTNTDLVNVPYPGCTDRSVDCGNCLNTCAGFNLPACLDDSSCRNKLDAYRACLGPQCDKGEQCREEVLFDPNDANLVGLIGCLGTTCSTQCARSPVALQCELYCACMKDTCTTKPIAMSQDCVSDCLNDTATRDGTITYCRKYHCEFVAIAGADRTLHCDHAVGMRGECETPIVEEPPCEGNRVRNGFPCLAASDCCSNTCEGQTCIP